MIFVVYGPLSIQPAVVVRALAVAALTWALVGAPGSVAVATACAYASTGPDGTKAVAYAGS
ncbi:hypothetical protein N4G67_03200, partial [Streptomyces violarus]|nr:hypothetical protein [Streptomyces violarus]